jgi:DNA-binding transcriptional regulator YiaG
MQKELAQSKEKEIEREKALKILEELKELHTEVVRSARDTFAKVREYLTCRQEVIDFIRRGILSQQEVAVAIGVNKSTVSRWMLTEEERIQQRITQAIRFLQSHGYQVREAVSFSN